MDKDGIIEALNDFINQEYTSATEESVVLDDIEVNREDFKYLDPNNNHDLLLKKRVETKIRDLQEKINKGFFKKLPYPSDLYSKDLKTKIAYLNETFQDNCHVCKSGTLRLVPSGKVWMCTNRCGGKRWCTTDEIELLGVDIKRGQN